MADDSPKDDVPIPEERYTPPPPPEPIKLDPAEERGREALSKAIEDGRLPDVTHQVLKGDPAAMDGYVKQIANAAREVLIPHKWAPRSSPELEKWGEDEWVHVAKGTEGMLFPPNQPHILADTMADRFDKLQAARDSQPRLTGKVKEPEPLSDETAIQKTSPKDLEELGPPGEASIIGGFVRAVVGDWIKGSTGNSYDAPQEQQEKAVQLLRQSQDRAAISAFLEANNQAREIDRHYREQLAKAAEAEAALRAAKENAAKSKSTGQSSKSKGIPSSQADLAPSPSSKGKSRSATTSRASSPSVPSSYAGDYSYPDHYSEPDYLAQAQEKLEHHQTTLRGIEAQKKHPEAELFSKQDLKQVQDLAASAPDGIVPSDDNIPQELWGMSKRDIRDLADAREAIDKATDLAIQEAVEMEKEAREEVNQLEKAAKQARKEAARLEKEAARAERQAEKAAKEAEMWAREDAARARRAEEREIARQQAILDRIAQEEARKIRKVRGQAQKKAPHALKDLELANEEHAQARIRAMTNPSKKAQQELKRTEKKVAKAWGALAETLEQAGGEEHNVIPRGYKDAIETAQSGGGEIKAKHLKRGSAPVGYEPELARTPGFLGGVKDWLHPEERVVTGFTPRNQSAIDAEVAHLSAVEKYRRFIENKEAAPPGYRVDRGGFFDHVFGNVDLVRVGDDGRDLAPSAPKYPGHSEGAEVSVEKRWTRTITTSTSKDGITTTIDSPNALGVAGEVAGIGITVGGMALRGAGEVGKVTFEAGKVIVGGTVGAAVAVGGALIDMVLSTPEMIEDIHNFFQAWKEIGEEIKTEKLQEAFKAAGITIEVDSPEMATAIMHKIANEFFDRRSVKDITRNLTALTGIGYGPGDIINLAFLTGEMGYSPSQIMREAIAFREVGITPQEHVGIASYNLGVKRKERITPKIVIETQNNVMETGSLDGAGVLRGLRVLDEVALIRHEWHPQEGAQQTREEKRRSTVATEVLVNNLEYLRDVLGIATSDILWLARAGIVARDIQPIVQRNGIRKGDFTHDLVEGLVKLGPKGLRAERERVQYIVRQEQHKVDLDTLDTCRKTQAEIDVFGRRIVSELQWVDAFLQAAGGKDMVPVILSLQPFVDAETNREIHDRLQTALDSAVKALDGKGDKAQERVNAALGEFTAAAGRPGVQEAVEHVRAVVGGRPLRGERKTSLQNKAGRLRDVGQALAVERRQAHQETMNAAHRASRSEALLHENPRLENEERQAADKVKQAGLRVGSGAIPSTLAQNLLLDRDRHPEALSHQATMHTALEETPHTGPDVANMMAANGLVDVDLHVPIPGTTLGFSELTADMKKVAEAASGRLNIVADAARAIGYDEGESLEPLFVALLHYAQSLKDPKDFSLAGFADSFQAAALRNDAMRGPDEIAVGLAPTDLNASKVRRALNIIGADAARLHDFWEEAGRRMTAENISLIILGTIGSDPRSITPNYPQTLRDKENKHTTRIKGMWVVANAVKDAQERLKETLGELLNQHLGSEVALRQSLLDNTVKGPLVVLGEALVPPEVAEFLARRGVGFVFAPHSPNLAHLTSTLHDVAYDPLSRIVLIARGEGPAADHLERMRTRAGILQAVMPPGMDVYALHALLEDDQVHLGNVLFGKLAAFEKEIGAGLPDKEKITARTGSMLRTSLLVNALLGKDTSDLDPALMDGTRAMPWGDIVKVLDMLITAKAAEEGSPTGTIATVLAFIDGLVEAAQLTPPEIWVRSLTKALVPNLSGLVNRTIRPYIEESLEFYRSAGEAAVELIGRENVKRGSLAVGFQVPDGATPLFTPPLFSLDAWEKTEVLASRMPSGRAMVEGATFLHVSSPTTPPVIIQIPGVGDMFSALAWPVISGSDHSLSLWAEYNGDPFREARRDLGGWLNGQLHTMAEAWHRIHILQDIDGGLVLVTAATEHLGAVINARNPQDAIALIYKDIGKPLPDFGGAPPPDWQREVHDTLVPPLGRGLAMMGGLTDEIIPGIERISGLQPGSLTASAAPSAPPPPPKKPSGPPPVVPPLPDGIDGNTIDAWLDETDEAAKDALAEKANRVGEALQKSASDLRTLSLGKIGEFEQRLADRGFYPVIGFEQELYLRPETDAALHNPDLEAFARNRLQEFSQQMRDILENPPNGEWRAYIGEADGHIEAVREVLEALEAFARDPNPGQMTHRELTETLHRVDSLSLVADLLADPEQTAAMQQMHGLARRVASLQEKGETLAHFGLQERIADAAKAQGLPIARVYSENNLQTELVTHPGKPDDMVVALEQLRTLTQNIAHQHGFTAEFHNHRHPETNVHSDLHISLSFWDRPVTFTADGRISDPNAVNLFVGLDSEKTKVTPSAMSVAISRGLVDTFPHLMPMLSPDIGGGKFAENLSGTAAAPMHMTADKISKESNAIRIEPGDGRVETRFVSGDAPPAQSVLAVLGAAEEGVDLFLQRPDYFTDEHIRTVTYENLSRDRHGRDGPVIEPHVHDALQAFARSPIAARLFGDDYVQAILDLHNAPAVSPDTPLPIPTPLNVSNDRPAVADAKGRRTEDWLQNTEERVTATLDEAAKRVGDAIQAQMSSLRARTIEGIQAIEGDLAAQGFYVLAGAELECRLTPSRDAWDHRKALEGRAAEALEQLAQDLEAAIATLRDTPWQTRDGTLVPPEASMLQQSLQHARNVADAARSLCIDDPDLPDFSKSPLLVSFEGNIDFSAEQQAAFDVIHAARGRVEMVFSDLQAESFKPNRYAVKRLGLEEMILDRAREAGIAVTRIYGEGGALSEIVTPPLPPLEMAEQLEALKALAHQVAEEHGWAFDVHDTNPDLTHADLDISVSVWDRPVTIGPNGLPTDPEAVNLFEGVDDDHPSALALAAAEGARDTLPHLMPMVAPRVTPKYANNPTTIGASPKNMSIKVGKSAKDDNAIRLEPAGKASRMEIRPHPSSTPAHEALLATLASLEEGIRLYTSSPKRFSPEMVPTIMQELVSEDGAPLEPDSIAALNTFANSPVARRVLGDEYVDELVGAFGGLVAGITPPRDSAEDNIHPSGGGGKGRGAPSGNDPQPPSPPGRGGGGDDGITPPPPSDATLPEDDDIPPNGRIRVIQITAPHVISRTGDTDFTWTITGALKGRGFKASFFNRMGGRPKDEELRNLRALREEHPDTEQIIHIQLRPPVQGTYFTPEELAGLGNIVVTVHEYEALDEKGRALVDGYAAVADQLIFSSEADRDMAAAVTPSVMERSTIIPIPITLPEAFVGKTVPADERPLNILHWGSIHQGNGQHHAVELAKAIQQDPDLMARGVKVIIAGTPTNAVAVKNLIKEVYGVGDDEVRLIGRNQYWRAGEVLDQLKASGREPILPVELYFGVENERVPEIFSQARILYHSSEHGLRPNGTSAVTAMSHDMACVAHEGARTNDEMRAAAEMVHSPEEALAAIKNLIEHPEQERALRQRSADYAATRTPDAAAEAHEGVYRGLLRQRQRGAPLSERSDSGLTPASGGGGLQGGNPPGGTRPPYPPAPPRIPPEDPSGPDTPDDDKDDKSGEEKGDGKKKGGKKKKDVDKKKDGGDDAPPRMAPTSRRTSAIQEIHPRDPRIGPISAWPHSIIDPAAAMGQNTLWTNPLNAVNPLPNANGLVGSLYAAINHALLMADISDATMLDGTTAVTDEARMVLSTLANYGNTGRAAVGVPEWLPPERDPDRWERAQKSTLGLIERLQAGGVIEPEAADYLRALVERSEEEIMAEYEHLVQQDTEALRAYVEYAHLPVEGAKGHMDVMFDLVAHHLGEAHHWVQSEEDSLELFYEVARSAKPEQFSSRWDDARGVNIVTINLGGRRGKIVYEEWLNHGDPDSSTLLSVTYPDGTVVKPRFIRYVRLHDAPAGPTSAQYHYEYTPDGPKPWDDVQRFFFAHPDPEVRAEIMDYLKGMAEHFIDLGVDDFRLDAVYQLPQDMLWELLDFIREYTWKTQVGPDGQPKTTEAFGEVVGGIHLSAHLANGAGRKRADGGFEPILDSVTSGIAWTIDAFMRRGERNFDGLRGEIDYLRKMAHRITGFVTSHDSNSWVQFYGDPQRAAWAMQASYAIAAMLSDEVFMMTGFDQTAARYPTVFRPGKDAAPLDVGERIDIGPFIAEINGIKALWPEGATPHFEVVPTADNDILVLRVTLGLSRDEAGEMIIGVSREPGKPVRLDDHWVDGLLGNEEGVQRHIGDSDVLGGIVDINYIPPARERGKGDDHAPAAPPPDKGGKPPGRGPNGGIPDTNGDNDPDKREGNPFNRKGGGDPLYAPIRDAAHERHNALTEQLTTNNRKVVLGLEREGLFIPQLNAEAEAESLLLEEAGQMLYSMAQELSSHAAAIESMPRTPLNKEFLDRRLHETLTQVLEVLQALEVASLKEDRNRLTALMSTLRKDSAFCDDALAAQLKDFRLHVDITLTQALDPNRHVDYVPHIRAVESILPTIDARRFNLPDPQGSDDTFQKILGNLQKVFVEPIDIRDPNIRNALKDLLIECVDSMQRAMVSLTFSTDKTGQDILAGLLNHLEGMETLSLDPASNSYHVLQQLAVTQVRAEGLPFDKFYWDSHSNELVTKPSESAVAVETIQRMTEIAREVAERFKCNFNLGGPQDASIRPSLHGNISWYDGDGRNLLFEDNGKLSPLGLAVVDALLDEVIPQTLAMFTIIDPVPVIAKQPKILFADPSHYNAAVRIRYGDGGGYLECRVPPASADPELASIMLMTGLRKGEERFAQNPAYYSDPLNEISILRTKNAPAIDEKMQKEAEQAFGSDPGTAEVLGRSLRDAVASLANSVTSQKQDQKNQDKDSAGVSPLSPPPSTPAGNGKGPGNGDAPSGGGENRPVDNDGGAKEPLAPAESDSLRDFARIWEEALASSQDGDEHDVTPPDGEGYRPPKGVPAPDRDGWSHALARRGIEPPNIHIAQDIYISASGVPSIMVDDKTKFHISAAEFARDPAGKMKKLAEYLGRGSISFYGAEEELIQNMRAVRELEVIRQTYGYIQENIPNHPILTTYPSVDALMHAAGGEFMSTIGEEPLDRAFSPLEWFTHLNGPPQGSSSRRGANKATVDIVQKVEALETTTAAVRATVGGFLEGELTRLQGVGFRDNLPDGTTERMLDGFVKNPRHFSMTGDPARDVLFPRWVMPRDLPKMQAHLEKMIGVGTPDFDRTVENIETARAQILENARQAAFPIPQELAERVSGINLDTLTLNGNGQPIRQSLRNRHVQRRVWEAVMPQPDTYGGFIGSNLIVLSYHDMEPSDEEHLKWLKKHESKVLDPFYHIISEEMWHMALNHRTQEMEPLWRRVTSPGFTLHSDNPVSLRIQKIIKSIAGGELYSQFPLNFQLDEVLACLPRSFILRFGEFSPEILREGLRPFIGGGFTGQDLERLVGVYTGAVLRPDWVDREPPPAPLSQTSARSTDDDDAKAFLDSLRVRPILTPDALRREIELHLPESPERVAATDAILTQVRIQLAAEGHKLGDASIELGDPSAEVLMEIRLPDDKGTIEVQLVPSGDTLKLVDGMEVAATIPILSGNEEKPSRTAVVIRREARAENISQGDTPDRKWVDRVERPDVPTPWAERSAPKDRKTPDEGKTK